MNLAKNVQAKAILVLTGVGKGSIGEYRDTWSGFEPDYVADNVLAAVNWILQQETRREFRPDPSG